MRASTLRNAIQLSPCSRPLPQALERRVGITAHRMRGGDVKQRSARLGRQSRKQLLRFSARTAQDQRTRQRGDHS
jgi:hypothetical protein